MHRPDRLEQSADYLPGFAAAPMPDATRHPLLADYRPAIRCTRGRSHSAPEPAALADPPRRDSSIPVMYHSVSKTSRSTGKVTAVKEVCGQSSHRIRRVLIGREVANPSRGSVRSRVHSSTPMGVATSTLRDFHGGVSSADWANDESTAGLCLTLNASEPPKPRSASWTRSGRSLNALCSSKTVGTRSHGTASGGHSERTASRGRRFQGAAAGVSIPTRYESGGTPLTAQ